MAPVTFTPAARFEVMEALNWYDNKAVGLGRRFRIEVDAVVERIRANPRQFPTVHKQIRRALLQHYPYALMFIIEADGSISVIACFHASRNPIRWQERI